MDTLMLRTKPRKSNTGTRISYEVLGISNGADVLKETIVFTNLLQAGNRSAIDPDHFISL